MNINQNGNPTQVVVPLKTPITVTDSTGTRMVLETISFEMSVGNAGIALSPHMNQLRDAIIRLAGGRDPFYIGLCEDNELQTLAVEMGNRSVAIVQERLEEVVKMTLRGVEAVAE